MTKFSITSSLLKPLLIALLPLLLIGYFWGSSGSLQEADLNQIIQINVPVDPGRDTLTVMTFNIGYLSGMTNNLPLKPDPELFHGNLEKTIQFLDRINPDLVGFQEIDFGSARSLEVNQLEVILKSCEIPFAHKSINWDKKYVPFPYWPPNVHFGKMLSGQAITSKFPIDKGVRTILEKPNNQPFYYSAFYLDRLIQVAEISIDERKLIVMNVHLEAYDRATRERQAHFVLEAYRKYAITDPVLLIGDFNARPPYAQKIVEPEQTIQLFLDEPNLLPAISKEVYLENESRYFTFDSERPYEKLDYIFYNSSQIRMVDSYVAKEAETVSDHLPVVMRFKLLSD